MQPSRISKESAARLRSGRMDLVPFYFWLWGGPIPFICRYSETYPYWQDDGHGRSFQRLLRQFLEVSKLLVRPLNVGSNEVKECPLPVAFAHLRQYHVQNVGTACPVRLCMGDRLTKKHQVIAKSSNIRCISYLFAMARNELC